MSTVEELETSLTAKFEALFPHLDERQRRLVLGAEARAIGHGGITLVAQAAGVGAVTVSRGVRELEAGEEPLGRVRKPGGGRKRAAETDPGLRPALLALVEPDQRGDPMSPLRWTTKSTRKLAAHLTRQGHRISADTVGDLLRQEGFSLQANAKTIEGAQHPDRDAQFRYINEQVKEHINTGDPVISVDTKKKELVGEYKNAGREWEPHGEPTRVNTHDFPDTKLGKAIPYGIYDVAANTGWVNVGTDHDTAAFALASIGRWWRARGHADYPHARRLLITADAGGSNGYRTRAWKAELAAFASQSGLAITVCHLPPGTSKWNQIEHRLFCHITMNWRGRPLTSHDVIVNSIAATSTRSGLKVEAALDTGAYATGVKITDAQIDALPLKRHRFHGDWNYTLHPAHGDPPPGPPENQHTADTPAFDEPRRLPAASLRDFELTGMTQEQLDALVNGLTIALHEQRERLRHERRGTDRHRAPGAGAKDRLDPADRILATILYLRGLGAQELLGRLFGVDRSTITRAIAEVRPLLNQRGYDIPASTARFRTRADVIAFLAPTPETTL